MTRRLSADHPHFFADAFDTIRQRRRERFVRQCLVWASARSLADDLASLGVEVSERRCAEYRARQFKSRPGEVADAVAFLVERRKVAEAKAELRRIESLLE